MISPCILPGKIYTFLLLFALVTSASNSWSLKQFSSLVVFGDSYTDESRFNYFAAHNGSAPPAGTLLPENLHAADGGRVWARYVVQYSRESLNLFNYAVSGAVCSNEITPRFTTLIDKLFPDLAGYEIPAFKADMNKGVNIITGQPYFQPGLNHTNAVYAIWDGTNDLGNYAFIDDEEVTGKSIPDYVGCIFDQVGRLYELGARYFVIFNIAPLYLNGEYANSSFGGQGPNQFWPNKPSSNLTAISEKMRQYVMAANAIYQYQLPYEALVKSRYPGAQLALYNVNQLFNDIHRHPSRYLNGSLPLHVNGHSHHCNVNGTDCMSAKNPDSYLWYDELHPSEQTERIIAKHFIDILEGRGKYATYYGT